MNDTLLKEIDDLAAEKQKRIAKVIADIEANHFHLSWSSANAFMDSPKDFMAYKIKDRVTTEAMLLGSATDCYLLTPDKFDKKYFTQGDIVTYTKEQQKEFGIAKEDLLTVEEQKKNEKAKLYDENKGKDLITLPQLKKVILAATAIKENPAAAALLEQIGETQTKLEWWFMGFKFIGYMDAKGDNLVVDLKQCPNAEYSAFKRKVYNERLYVQGAIYLKGAILNKLVGENAVYKLLAYDHDGGVSVHTLMPDLLWKGLRKYIKFCRDFTNCIATRSWDLSYDYYTDQGSYSIEDVSWLTL